VKGNKIQEIINYLSNEFPDSEIINENDFSSDSELFKVKNIKGFYLLKVGDELFDDNEASEILQLFNSWNVPIALKENSTLGVLTTRTGIEIFERL